MESALSFNRDWQRDSVAIAGEEQALTPLCHSTGCLLSQTNSEISWYMDPLKSILLSWMKVSHGSLGSSGLAKQCSRELYSEINTSCSAVLCKECLLNGPQFSETAWLCQLRHRKSLYQNPESHALQLGTGQVFPPLHSTSKTSGTVATACAEGFPVTTAPGFSLFPFHFTPFTCPWWALSGAFHWCPSAAHWGQFEGNHKVMVVFASLATPELCGDWEMIQDPFVLEHWGSCRSYRKSVLEELSLHSHGNLETSE